MDDCNSDALKTLNPTNEVQIPLWTIVTPIFISVARCSSGSDSSMDDCNAVIKNNTQAMEHSSDSSMDDCNQRPNGLPLTFPTSSDSSMDDCNGVKPDAALDLHHKFRFLYGRL